MTTTIKSSGSYLRKYILKNNLLEYRCSICKLDPIWNFSPLILELDHIDGNRDHNELINLRFLCPNCHSQQPSTNDAYKKVHRVSEEDVLTAAAKCENIKQILNHLKLADGGMNYKRVKRVLVADGRFTHLLNERKEYTSFELDKLTKINLNKSPYCAAYRPLREKIKWPSDEELQNLINTQPLIHIAKTLGVSSTAIKKRAMKRKLILKSQGYWLKKCKN